MKRVDRKRSKSKEISFQSSIHFDDLLESHIAKIRTFHFYILDYLQITNKHNNFAKNIYQ